MHPFVSRNRFYSPDTGRFGAIDPLGNFSGLNWYGYCAGDPVNSWDPTGAIIEIGENNMQLSANDMAFQSPVQQQLFNLMAGSSKRYWFSSLGNLRTRMGSDRIRAQWAGDVDFANSYVHSSATGAFLGSIGSDASQQADDMWGGLKVIADGETSLAVNQVQNQMADRMAQVMIRENDDSWTFGITLAAGDVTGVTQAGEAYYGVDIAEARLLSTEERWQRGLTGGGGIVLSVTGGAGTLNSARTSLAAGYTGTGIAGARQIGTALRQMTKYEGFGWQKLKNQARMAAQYEGTGIEGLGQEYFRTYTFGGDKASGNPYFRHGHSGVSLDRGRTIPGFGPAGPVDGAARNAIKRGTGVPGAVTDDVDVFRAAMVERPVKVVMKPVSPKVFGQARTAIARDMVGTGKSYLWPTSPHFTKGYNCLTYPASVGLPLQPNAAGGWIHMVMEGF